MFKVQFCLCIVFQTGANMHAKFNLRILIKGLVLDTSTVSMYPGYH